MKNKYWTVLIIGIVIRCVISFSTFHPDITALNFAGYIVQSGHIFSFYDYIFNLLPESVFTKAFAQNIFTYPPLIYLMQGLFNFIWLNIFQISFINDFIVVTNGTFGNPLFNVVIFLIKFPYLFFDIPIAFLLTKLVDSEKEKFLVFIFWIFNPINLFATYMMGQHDVIAVFFIVLSIFLATKQKLNWSVVALGMGIAFKIFPIFLLIPLVLLEKTWRKRIQLLILGLLPYIVSILPFLYSKGYRMSALFANQSSKSLFAQIPVSGGESILLFPATLLFVYLAFLYIKNEMNHLWQKYFIIMLIFFIFTHTHPQWFLWLTPFLILDLVRTNFRHLIPVLLSLISFKMLLLFFDPSLSVGLFAPVWPYLATLPSVWELMNISVDYNFYRSVFQTLFVGVAMYYIYYYYPKQKPG